MLNTPIAFIIFNRPRHVKKTFEVIRGQKPSKLFIIADGPRQNKPDDAELCKLSKEIVDNIDWPCEVHKNYSDTNLGCKYRIITGINWVFEHTDRAIILEDDCLPHSDFFTFCETLLKKYEDDDRISVITGNNFQNGIKRGDASYYYYKYNHVWGWATWKRAWSINDPDILFWPNFKKTENWSNLCSDIVERNYWERIFDKVYTKNFETAWDYPWTACNWFHGGLTATPNVNLVTNIGFGPDGTHTVTATDQEGLPVEPLGPLTHPKTIQQDRKADRYTFDHVFGGLQHRWQTKLRRLPRKFAGFVWRGIIKGPSR